MRRQYFQLFLQRLTTHVGQSHALAETSVAAAVQILNGGGEICAVNLSMANRHGMSVVQKSQPVS